MPYVRLSIARPRPGYERRLEEIMTELTKFAALQPGCVEAFVMRPSDSSGEIGRMAIYTSEADAEQAANTDHVMALRSELHIACEPGHIERAFNTI